MTKRERSGNLFISVAGPSWHHGPDESYHNDSKGVDTRSPYHQRMVSSHTSSGWVRDVCKARGHLFGPVQPVWAEEGVLVQLLLSFLASIVGLVWLKLSSNNFIFVFQIAFFLSFFFKQLFLSSRLSAHRREIGEKGQAHFPTWWLSLYKDIKSPSWSHWAKHWGGLWRGSQVVWEDGNFDIEVHIFWPGTLLVYPQRQQGLS